MTPDDLTAALLERTLPAADWTHRAHLTAGYVLVCRHGAAEALALLRASIAAYNASLGNQNTDHSGYHETITAYFVWAIDRIAARGGDLDDVIADPLTQHRAPLAYWRRETLFSVPARRGWVAPDLVAPDAGDAPQLAGRVPALGR